MWAATIAIPSTSDLLSDVTACARLRRFIGIARLPLRASGVLFNGLSSAHAWHPISTISALAVG
jgi:hypothetical protein